MSRIDFMFFLNIVGTVAFAISGSMKGIKYSLDILGIVVLGVITAIGGGIIRDILLNTVPEVLINEVNLIVAIIASIIPFVFAKKIYKISFLIQLFDALGLAVFTIIGARRGLSHNLGALGVIIMATSTGVAGGMIRDIMVGEIPFVLKEEIYASFCILGGLLFYLSIKYFHLPEIIVAYFLILLIFVGRILAIKFELQLPRA